MSIRITSHFSDRQPPLVEVIDARNVAEADAVVAARLAKPEGFVVTDQSEPSRGE